MIKSLSIVFPVFNEELRLKSGFNHILSFLRKKKKFKIEIIFVDDDGPGIPEHEKENVLKPFYRMDESRSQNKSGVGLGLSIAYDIIRSHGGDMLLETSPQKGLRVKISLPS